MPQPKKKPKSKKIGIKAKLGDKRLGNQFWKQRSKHGRDMLFATPDLLWEAACEYFQWCDENPWTKNEAVKAGDHFGELVQIPTQRPYTITGFLLYIGASEAYWRQFKLEEHEDFSTVIPIIEKVMYTQKFEGAAVGAFNANIISRDLGLVEKKDLTTGGESLNKAYYDFIKARRTKKP